MPGGAATEASVGAGAGFKEGDEDAVVVSARAASELLFLVVPQSLGGDDEVSVPFESCSAFTDAVAEAFGLDNSDMIKTKFRSRLDALYGPCGPVQ